MRSHDARAGHDHRFVVRDASLTLRIRVQDIFGEPIAGADCTLEVDGQKFELTADGDAIIEQAISPTAAIATLTVRDMIFPLQIGHLDPPEETTGVEARLINLGYYPGAVGDDDLDALHFAAELFQNDQKLPITGNFQDILQDLEDAHGC